MSQCNYCIFKGMQHRAKDNSQRITMLQRVDPIGGVDVYMHARNVKIKHGTSKKIKDRWFVAWFMELTQHCVC